MTSLLESTHVRNYEEGVLQTLYQIGLKVSALALLKLVQHGYEFGEPFGYAQLRKAGLSERIAGMQ